MKDKAHGERTNALADRTTDQTKARWSRDLEALGVATFPHAIGDPSHAPSTDILVLQRLAGNRAVSGLIQAKLTVGAVGDRHEQEADRVADKVMGMPVMSPAAQRQEDEEELQTKPLIQRQEEEEELQTKPFLQRQEDEEELQTKPLIQRQEDEEELQTKPFLQRQEDEEELQTKPFLQRQEDEEELQTKPAQDAERQADGSLEAGSGIERRLAANRGAGSPLPVEVRAFMEPRFGADFGGVRVHTGGDAVQMNRELSAQAFTHGQDIYLGAGRYDPHSTPGRRLLAHELTHVVQQTGAAKLQRRAGPRPAQIHTDPSSDQIRLKTVNMYLDFVRLKRNQVKWAAILLPKFMQSKKKQSHEGGLYGHWWTEIGSLKPTGWNPKESYGWWPEGGVGLLTTFTGVKGALNAGEGDQDPDHGDPGEQEFHPVMAVDDTKSYDDVRTDVVNKIRAFARGYKGKWMWRFGWGKNCHTFQEKLMKTVGLKKGTAKQWLKKPPKPPKVRLPGRPFQVSIYSEVYQLDKLLATGHTLDAGDPIEVLDPKYKAGDASGDLIHIRFKTEFDGKEVEGRVPDWNIEETGALGGLEHEDPKQWPPGPRWIIMGADRTFKVATGESTNPLTEDLALKANTRIRVVVLDDLTNAARCRIDHAGKFLYARLRDVLGEPPGAKTGTRM